MGRLGTPADVGNAVALLVQRDFHRLLIEGWHFRASIAYKNVELSELRFHLLENPADLSWPTDIGLNQKAVRPELADLRQRALGSIFI
jgi:hypothetical protein